MAPLPAIFETILSHPRRVVALFALLTAVAVPGLARLSLDNSPESFFLRDAETLERYRELQRAFGRDRALRLVAAGPGLWTPAGLAWLGRLEVRAAALRGVLGAAGLWSHHRDHLGVWPPADPAAFRQRVLEDVLDRNAGFVAEGGEAATVLVVLYKLSLEEERALLGRLEALLTEPPPGVRTAVVGLASIQRAFDAEGIHFAVRFFPLLVLLALVLMTLAFGGAGDLWPPFLFVFVCQVVTFGIMGAAGVPLDMVRMVLFPLLFVIPLATAVHLTVRFRQLRRRGAGATAAVRETWREKGWPVLWTGVTTAAGLGSLAASGVPPVRSLGIWSALGLGWATLSAFTLLPALLALWPAAGAPGSREVRAKRWGRAWTAMAVRHRGWVVAGFCLAAALAAAGLPRLRQESNLLRYLPAEHPIRRQVQDLERQGIGVVTADLVLVDRRRRRGSVFDQATGLAALASLAAELRREPVVLGAVSAGDLLASETDWRGGREIGDSTEPPEAALARLREDRRKERLLAALLSWDGRWARVSLLIPMLGFEQLDPLFDRAQRQAQQAFPEAEVWLSGRYPLVLSSQRSLLSTMIASLSMTFLVVTLVFRWVLGSTRLTVLALVPNLWPVLGVLGAMGWWGVPLDSSTVMIASVVLGLAVDDTFHTLGAFRRDVRRLDARRAVVTALGRTAPAHLLTTAVLSLGFAVCGLSSFVPIARFGGLTSLALVAALAADLWLVPALLAATPSRSLARLRGTPTRAVTRYG